MNYERNVFMREINISTNIADLRRKKGITQEQLAIALNVSPQAVSKWETNTSQPDMMTIPLIADFFGVSIDYLYYGKELSYGEIYTKAYDKVVAHTQMSKEAFEDEFKIFAYSHFGVARWNPDINKIHNEPNHMSSENGLSLVSGKGYGAVLTREFFESIDRDTAKFASSILPVLSSEVNVLVCMAIISMSDISYGELQEKLGFDDGVLRAALDELTRSGIVIEEKSKHKSLGFTYKITDMYHTCLCILLATLEMQRYSLEGISCCMGYGDYPINL